MDGVVPNGFVDGVVPNGFDEMNDDAPITW